MTLPRIESNGTAPARPGAAREALKRAVRPVRQAAAAPASAGAAPATMPPASSAAPAPATTTGTPAPRPPGAKRKKSGWANRGTLTPDEFRKTKAQMATELAEAQQRAAEAEAHAARITAAQEPEKQAAIAKGLAGIARLATNYMASRNGAHWKLKPHEETAIGESGAEALGPWLGDLVQYAPFVIFAGVLYTTIDDRVQIDNRLRKRGEAPIFDGEASAPATERYSSSAPEPDARPPMEGVEDNRIVGPIR